MNTNAKTDPVTGNSYEAELAMYIRYHGFSKEDAERVMAATSYSDRDRVFWSIIHDVIDELTAKSS